MMVKMKIELRAVGVVPIAWHEQPYFRKALRKDFIFLFYRCLFDALRICSSQYSDEKFDSFKIAIPQWDYNDMNKISKGRGYRIFKTYSNDDRHDTIMEATTYLWLMNGMSPRVKNEDVQWQLVRVFDKQILPEGSTFCGTPRGMRLKANYIGTVTQLIVHEIIDAIESKECVELANKQKRNVCAKDFPTHEEHHKSIIRDIELPLFNEFFKCRWNSWTPYEKELLRMLYPKASREILQKELWLRSWKAIRMKAEYLGLKRK